MKTLNVLFALFFLSGCGTRVGTGLTLKSTSYSTAATVLPALPYVRSAVVDDLFLANPSRLTGPSVNSFRFCIEKLKMEKEDGTHAQKNSSEDLEFKIGLLDVTDGQEKTWASSDLPTGFSLKRIKVKVHKDKDLCGVDYSVKFNEFEASSDVEFRFVFQPAVTVAPGETLKLTLSSIVAVLRNAAGAAQLTNGNLKDYIEGVEDSGKKD